MTKIEKLATQIVATLAEKEVERLLKVILKRTPYANKAFAVGGYVRDQMLGLEAKDLDIVVEMRNGGKKLTHFLKEILKEKISTPRQMGAGYPIWQITFKDNIEHNKKTYRTKGAIIEFADTMKESFPDDKSRQRETEYGSLEEDVERRDFTVNMLLKDLTTGEVKDLAGVSKSDLKKGVLRGHPRVSLDTIFKNDPLRMIRLIRFQAKYNWQVPRSVLKTVKRNAGRIKIVSAERIMEELKKVMKLGKLAKAIRMMKATGLLKHVFPEVEALQGVQHDERHHKEGDVYKHTIRVLKNAPATIEGQLAALLHDIGKPKVQNILEDKIQFLGHETAGGEIAKAILYRLKFDTTTINKVVKMVESHMRPHQLSRAKGSGDKAIRKFIRNVGDEMVDAIVDLAEADVLGRIPVENYIPELRDKIKKVRKAPIKINKEPVLNGQEIMDILGVKPGPVVGKVKNFLIDLEDDYASRQKELSKEDAMKAVKQEFKRQARKRKVSKIAMEILSSL